MLRRRKPRRNFAWLIADARLTDLKIDGQVATANVVQTRDGKKQTTPIKFAKHGNRWKIDEFELN